MNRTFRILTLIKKQDAHLGGVFCSLSDGQPLLIARDDGRAFVSDLNNTPVGHVSDPTHSGEIVARIAAGEILLAKTVGRCFCVSRSILVWSEGIEKEETVRRQKIAPIKEKV